MSGAGQNLVLPDQLAFNLAKVAITSGNDRALDSLFACYSGLKASLEDSDCTFDPSSDLTSLMIACSIRHYRARTAMFARHTDSHRQYRCFLVSISQCGSCQCGIASVRSSAYEPELDLHRLFHQFIN